MEGGRLLDQLGIYGLLDQLCIGDGGGVEGGGELLDQLCIGDGGGVGGVSCWINCA